jgi:hypothetical protein
VWLFLLPRSLRRGPRLVPLGEGVLELGEHELVLGSLGEPLRSHHVGEVGDGDVDSS